MQACIIGPLGIVAHEVETGPAFNTSTSGRYRPTHLGNGSRSTIESPIRQEMAKDTSAGSRHSQLTDCRSAGTRLAVALRK